MGGNKDKFILKNSRVNDSEGKLLRAFQNACEFGADSTQKRFLAREDFQPSAYVTFLSKLPQQNHPFLPCWLFFCRLLKTVKQNGNYWLGKDRRLCA